MKYTNNYIRPDWIKKPGTVKAFNLFEKIMNDNPGKYIVDWHCFGNTYSFYLIPIGKGDLSYNGHPDGTIRLSNHWSWYANIKKCANKDFVQCHLNGINPRSRFKDNPDKATKPIWMTSIAICKNNIYIPLKNFDCNLSIALLIKKHFGTRLYDMLDNQLRQFPEDANDPDLIKIKEFLEGKIDAVKC